MKIGTLGTTSTEKTYAPPEVVPAVDGVAAVVGIDRYGESAPGNVLFEHFGFTAQNVVATVKAVLKKSK